MRRKKTSDKLAQAGYSVSKSGKPDGVVFSWLRENRRSFSDILSQWVDSYETPSAFLSETGLDAALSEPDLSALISTQKAPSRELTHLLCALVPNEIISWIGLRYRGYKAASEQKEQTQLTPEALQAVRLHHLKKIARSPIISTDGSSPIQGWLEEKIEELGQKYGKNVNVPQSINGLAKAIDLPVAQLTGKKPVAAALIEEKSRELANLLELEPKEYDATKAFIKDSWTKISTTQQANMPLPRALRFLRHTIGMSHLQFSHSSNIDLRSLFHLEDGNHAITRNPMEEIALRCNLLQGESGLFGEIVKAHAHAIGSGPPAQEEDRSASMLSQGYRVDRVVANEQLEELQRKLVQDIIHYTGMDEETAAANVAHFLIGTRKPSRGPDALFATPDGIRIWEDSYKKKKRKHIAPQAGKDEKSATTLSREYAHHSPFINRQLEELRNALIVEQQAEKSLTEEEATAYVDRHLVGVRKTRGPEALHATPAGVQLWIERYNPIHRNAAPPSAAQEDKTATALEKIYVGGRGVIRKELLALRDQLVDDVVAAGIMSEDEAEQNVEHFLIGMRSPKKGPVAIHATPDGIRTWEHAYERRKRSPDGPTRN